MKLANFVCGFTIKRNYLYMKSDPASRIFALTQFGEFGDVNPSICDSATFTFMQAKTIMDTFQG